LGSQFPEFPVFPSIFVAVNVAKYISGKTFQSSRRNFAGFIVRLTAFAVALSIAVMLISICVIKGFRSQISEKVFGVWGHIHITHVNAQRFEEVPFADTAQWIDQLNSLKTEDINNEVFGSFQQPIDHIQYFAHFPAIIRGKEDIDGLIIKGVDSTFGWQEFDRYLDKGQTFEVYRDSNNVRPIMISRNSAQRLQLDVGDKVIVYFIKEGKQIPRRFTISGIYHTGVSEFDKKLAFAPFIHVKEVMGWSKEEIGGLEIFIKDLSHLEDITRYIFYEIVPNDMYARSIKSKLYPIFQWLELQKVNEYVILILMLII
jgi:lipoprotein-releasing system permease protein